VTANQPFSEVESTKSVSDVYAPVSGTVVERNALLETRPELVNESPYGDGWIVVLEGADALSSTGSWMRPRIASSSGSRRAEAPVPDHLSPRPTGALVDPARCER
jgi:glycine cleavage system H lipoate-binding protein